MTWNCSENGKRTSSRPRIGRKQPCEPGKHAACLPGSQGCFLIKAVHDPKTQKSGVLSFPSSSTPCKTMVSRICKTMGKMTPRSDPYLSFSHAVLTFLLLHGQATPGCVRNKVSRP